MSSEDLKGGLSGGRRRESPPRSFAPSLHFPLASVAAFVCVCVWAGAFVQKCSFTVEKRWDRKCIFSAQAINLLKCSWPDILLVPLIDGRGGKRKWFSSPLLLRTTYFRDVPCGRRSPPRRTTRQRHHPQLRSKLSYLAIYVSKPMHMD